ncbi:hypothetical protein EJ02DRAFT_37232 [Clathrospora elynae]|uniref:DUF8035 domain-containing protein n=1 Tax=Clathrospora elynae TaxID=706981 RepID=A0A6A5T0F3_9PLEO|nr:hypothetical protein EJ02DRAFT_37232 [Clathrospora elynae]
MLFGSVTTPSGLRRNTYSSPAHHPTIFPVISTSHSIAPPLPPRPTTLTTTPSALTAPLQLTSITVSGGMESRYTRPSSPRSRHANPARSSTGTFADPYYDSSHYGRPSSPRTSGDRIGGPLHSPHYAPSSSTSTRTSNLKYDSYTTRPRRNTNDLTRPTVSSSALPTTSMPLRTPYSPHSQHDRPSSPLAPSYDKRDTYITPGASRREHKKVYSVDDSSRSTKLVAEIEPARHRDSADRGYSLTSGGRSYHDSKPPPRLTDLGSDGYSYTDPASMYRDTEPAWRRPRAGSLERGSRPTSMILDRAPRAPARELGPPPSTRGFDKINSSVPRPHVRSPSIERARETPKYEAYPDAGLGRSTSTRQHAPAIHQEREPRRDSYRDEYDRRDRDVENKRHSTADRFEDREVTSRGFGIAPGIPSLAHDHHALDRQPLYPAAELVRVRQPEPGNQYYQPERADARMPDPRSSRERDLAPPKDSYEKRPRERESGRHDSTGGFVPAAAGAAAGMAATLGAAGYMKSRDKERERESDRDSSGERERERRKEYDERDRRDRPDERREREPRDRRSEGHRHSVGPPPPPPAAIPVAPVPASVPAPAAAVATAYAPVQEIDRKPRERRYEDDDRERSSRKVPSSEGSEEERPRHYVDRDTDRRRDQVPKEAALDPDEEYRRRVQQEAERSSRSVRERDSDSDREKDRRRRKDERARSRDPEDRTRASPPSEAQSSRYDERSLSVYDGTIVKEPESMDRAQDPPSKSVQIVEPSKEPVAPVKGILRRPTTKFPEEPEPIREGVAPHKDALKGKDIPIGARWTRIDRRLVNPEALEQAKERFEERMDCVIVLRVLTKEEIQKLADRTKKIRESREDEYDHDRHDRDKRSHRSSKDDRDDEDRDGERERGDRHRDRDHRRRYDDESEDELDRRERERPNKLEIEAPR